MLVFVEACHDTKKQKFDGKVSKNMKKEKKNKRKTKEIKISKTKHNTNTNTNKHDIH